MSKKNVVVVADVNENAVVNRKLLSPEQFLDKAAETSGGNCRSDNFQYLEVADTVVDMKKLNGAEFHFSKFSNVKFTNCNLCNAEFYAVEFNNVSFEHCKVDGAYFNFSKLNGVSFLECNLDRTEFDFAAGTAKFSGCSMERTEFPMCPLEAAFSGCNLHYAEFNGCHSLKFHAENSDLACCEFNDGVLYGSAENCVFTNSEFYGTNGSGFQFQHCRMRDLNLKGAVGITESDSGEADEDLDEELDKLFD